MVSNYSTFSPIDPGNQDQGGEESDGEYLYTNYLFEDNDSDNGVQPGALVPTTPAVKLKDTEDPKIQQERDAYWVPGLSGLKNMGNTCYMNSALQCIASLILFNSYLRKGKYEKRLRTYVTNMLAQKARKAQHLDDDAEVDVSRSQIEYEYSKTVTYQLGRLMKYMWRENCTLSPKSFKQIIGEASSEFKGWGQNDSQELISLILDRIHEETKTDVSVQFCNIPDKVRGLLDVRNKCASVMQNVNATDAEKQQMSSMWTQYRRENIDAVTVLDAYIYWKKYVKKGHSVITDLFTGLFLSEVVCSQCQYKSNSFESFQLMSLEVPASSTNNAEANLTDCLKAYSNTEHMTGNDQYSCSKCKIKVDATKKISVWEPPEILIIHLKRFQTYLANPKDPRSFKKTKITTKVNFPMEGLTLRDNYSPLKPNSANVTYKLWATVLHRGTCDFGHYIACSRNPVNGLWYEFNDDTVVHVPNDSIEKEVVTEQAYVLFYVRER